MENATGTIYFDDYARPFILLREEEKQLRLTGTEVLKSHILVARGVANKLRTSLGPKGMDKLLVSPDGDVVITNDGATILELMDVEHEVAKLLVDLAKSQDKEVGDGTTGVVVQAAALLERSQELLDKGLHPSRIADGYERAAKRAVDHLNKIAVPITVNNENTDPLVQAAMTALSSKVANKCQKHLAEIAVTAFTTTCDLSQSDLKIPVNAIVLRGKSGGQIEDTELIRGVILDKDFAHPQMKRSFEKIKVAVLCGSALQFPRLSTKHVLDLKSSQWHGEVSDYIYDWCEGILKTVLNVGVQLVIYSEHIEEMITHLFLNHGISAIESVPDITMVAESVGARVVPRVEELTFEKLGHADRVRVIDLGTRKDKLIAVEQLERAKLVSILVRGSNEAIVEEIKRNLQDALCVVRNLAKENAVVYGGGAAEISCSLALQQESLNISGEEQLVFQAFADALDTIPMTLAENAGLFPLQVLSELKARHTPSLGVDCMLTGTCDMREQGILEGLLAKKHQLILATQLVKMVLKIDDVRGPKSITPKDMPKKV